MEIIDKAMVEELTSWVRQELNHWNTANLDWVKLLPLKKNNRFHGHCTYPKRTAPRKRSFVHGYQIRCSLNTRPEKYPYVFEANVGTWQKKTGSTTLWGYNTERVKLDDPAECGIFLFGHELFHFIRHSRQTEGRNTQVQADRYGVEMLKRFRKERVVFPTKYETK